MFFYWLTFVPFILNANLWKLDVFTIDLNDFDADQVKEYTGGNTNFNSGNNWSNNNNNNWNNNNSNNWNNNNNGWNL